MSVNHNSARPRKTMRPALLLCLAIPVAFLLSGCEKKEDKGMARMPGLSAPAPASELPKNTAHQAPPLSQMAGHEGHGHDAATTAPMMIQAGQTKVMAGGNILQVAGLAFTVSDSWKNIKPENSIRVAEYQIDGSGGPAEMAVFYFGPNQGGGIEDNVRRWAGQFTQDPTSTGTEAQVARMEHDALKMALVKTEGTYNPGSMGPMGPKAEPKPNYALFGLVVTGGPEGSVFIKVTGPKATLDEQSKALETMAQSVRVSKYQ